MMEEEAGETPGLHRSTAPHNFHFYHMDLYDSEDRLQIFPEENTRMRREVVQAEITSEPRGAVKGKTQRDLEEEVDELVHLYGLEDDRSTFSCSFIQVTKVVFFLKKAKFSLKKIKTHTHTKVNLTQTGHFQPYFLGYSEEFKTFSFILYIPAILAIGLILESIAFLL